MRCSARRRRAAATISIARVIFWMFLTDAMRFLTSRWAMVGVRGRDRAPLDRCRLLLGGLLLGGRRGLGGRGAHGRRVLVGQRRALLVEVVAEVLRVALDGRVDRLLRLVLPVTAGDLGPDVGALGVRATRE